MARQAEQQYAYEDRIAELRARIDRTTSRQLLDQEQFEQKLDDLLRRQSTLESRATALGGLSDPGATGAFAPERSQFSGFFGERAVQAATDAPSSITIRCRQPQERQRGRRSPRSLRASPPHSIASTNASSSLSPTCRSVMRTKRANCAACSPISDFKLEDHPGERRAFRAGANAGRRQRFRARGDPHQYQLAREAEQLSRSLVIHTDPQADCRRDRHHLDLRRAYRSVLAHSRHAYRHRFPRRDRRSDLRDRGGYGQRRGLERRLRQDGGSRPRQRARHPLRPSVADHGHGRRHGSGSGRKSGAWARPAARPARICITKRASMAKRSIRKNSSTPARGSTRRTRTRE